jgi:hypothetical protein
MDPGRGPGDLAVLHKTVESFWGPLRNQGDRDYSTNSICPRIPHASYGREEAGMIIKFEIYNDGTFWRARGIGADIFTQGKTLDT